MNQVFLSAPGHHQTNVSRSILLLVVSLCLSLAQPFAAVAQTNAPASLPPAAQEALNKGIIAAKIPDYLLAIRYFEEARKIALQDPVIYLNLGLAESKIPGRELRSMTWFGAYLAAYPEAPNAAAVKEQIAMLEVRNQSNVSRLIKSVQDAANQMLPHHQSHYLGWVAVLWANAGDIAAALNTASSIKDYRGPYALGDIASAQAGAGDFVGAQRTVDLIQEAFYKTPSQINIAKAQAKIGDIAGAQKTLASAQKTADLIQDSMHKSERQIAIAEAQLEVGDIEGVKSSLAGALKTADLIQRDEVGKSKVQGDIAKALAKIGDIAGAQKTVDLMQDASWKTFAQIDIAKAQANSGDIAGAQKTLASALKNADLIKDAWDKSAKEIFISQAQRQIDSGDLSSSRRSTSDTQSAIQPVVTASDWLKKLDDGNKDNDCPLNTGPFLDLAGYLKSLPPSDNPEQVFRLLHETTEKIVKAQNIITRMLKQEAGN